MMLLNIPLLKNPLNWITVFLMVMIGLFAADAVIRYFRASDGDDPQTGASVS